MCDFSLKVHSGAFIGLIVVKIETIKIIPFLDTAVSSGFLLKAVG